MTRNTLTVGIVGYGAIGQAVASAISAHLAGNAAIAAILVRDPEKYGEIDHSSLMTTSLDTFLANAPGLVLEAAGQPALRTYGEAVLARGCDLLVTSIGAFTDEGFYERLVATAEANGARLLLASGALPAVDWLASVAPAGVHHVRVTQCKPIKSWIQTPAREMVDLTSLSEPTPFFKGTAREAASRFPKSSNITAMLALATAGLDNTHVTLIADPTSDEMYSVIEFEGEGGRIMVERRGVPSKLNPSTSADVPLNIVKAIRNLSSTVYFGP